MEEKEKEFFLTHSREWHKPLDQEPRGRGELVCSLDQNVKAHLGTGTSKAEEQG